MGWSRQFIEKVRDATDLTTVAGDFGDTKNAGPGKIKLNCHSQITMRKLLHATCRRNFSNVSAVARAATYSNLLKWSKIVILMKP